MARVIRKDIYEYYRQKFTKLKYRLEVKPENYATISLVNVARSLVVDSSYDRWSRQLWWENLKNRIHECPDVYVQMDILNLMAETMWQRRLRDLPVQEKFIPLAIQDVLGNELEFCADAYIKVCDYIIQALGDKSSFKTGNPDMDTRLKFIHIASRKHKQKIKQYVMGVRFAQHIARIPMESPLRFELLKYIICSMYGSGDYIHDIYRLLQKTKGNQIQSASLVGLVHIMVSMFEENGR